jgi:hypothetical protein
MASSVCARGRAVDSRSKSPGFNVTIDDVLSSQRPGHDARSCVSIKKFLLGFSPRRVSKLAVGVHSEFLGPLRVGASLSNQGAFFAKLRLKPPPFRWRHIRRGQGTRASCLSQGPGENRWMLFGDPSHVNASRWPSALSDIPANCRNYGLDCEKLSVLPVTDLCAGSQIGGGCSVGPGTRSSLEQCQTKIRGGSLRPARLGKSSNYLLIESLVIDPPFSIFTLITWIWPLSA